MLLSYDFIFPFARQTIVCCICNLLYVVCESEVKAFYWTCTHLNHIPIVALHKLVRLIVVDLRLSVVDMKEGEIL